LGGIGIGIGSAESLRTLPPNVSSGFHVGAVGTAVGMSSTETKECVCEFNGSGLRIVCTASSTSTVARVRAEAEFLETASLNRYLLR